MNADDAPQNATEAVDRAILVLTQRPTRPLAARDFIRWLEQDGYTVTALAAAPLPSEPRCDFDCDACRATDDEAAPLPSDTPAPTIDCLCGDIFPTVESFHEHLHISHPEADMPEPSEPGRLSIALQRAGALSPSHMTYHDLARCVLAALTDGRDDLGSPDEHGRHMVAPLPSDTPADGLPRHSAECAMQDDEEPCFCGVSDAYAMGLRDGSDTPADGLDVLAADMAVLAVSSRPCDWQDEHARDIRYAFGPGSQFALALTQEPRSGDDR